MQIQNFMQMHLILREQSPPPTPQKQIRLIASGVRICERALTSSHPSDMLPDALWFWGQALGIDSHNQFMFRIKS